MKAKYVMTDKGPILFPPSFNHKEFTLFNPISAGWVDIDHTGAETFGVSVGLGMKPSTYDSILIQEAFK
jgi:hypothetical protein